ncbi:MAG: hypothetical protein JXR37_25450 [Kiritimatiellae bacterium]|nr:hypothetical protein [Kiritimatiellia bacterium]
MKPLRNPNKWRASVPRAAQIHVLTRTVAACFALVSAAHAGEVFSSLQFRNEQKEPDVPATPPALQRVSFAETPPRIDGKLDDPCWQTAEPFSPFSVYRLKRLAVEQRQVKACFDQEHVYFAVVCVKAPGHQLVTRTTWNDDGHIWEDDEVELFLDPALRHVEYYQLIVNSAGNLFDARHTVSWVQDPAAAEVAFKTKRDTDKGWSSEAKLKVAVGEDAWVVEIAIPVRAMGVPGVPLGAKWGLEVTSANRRTGELTNWVPCDWHDPASYGQIWLGEPQLDVRDLSFGAAAYGENRCQAALKPLAQAGEYRVVVSVTDASGERQNATTVALAAGATRQIAVPYTIEARQGEAKAELTVADPRGRMVYYSVQRGEIPALLGLTVRPYGQFSDVREVRGKIAVSLGALSRQTMKLEAALAGPGGEKSELIPGIDGTTLEFGITAAGLKPGIHTLKVRLLDAAGAEVETGQASFGLAEPPL